MTRRRARTPTPDPTLDQTRVLLRRARTNFIHAMIQTAEAKDDGERARWQQVAAGLDAEIEKLEDALARRV